MHAVTIEVPATTSNLGPGYDCLGVALSIYNRVTVTRAAGEPGSVAFHGHALGKPISGFRFG